MDKKESTLRCRESDPQCRHGRSQRVGSAGSLSRVHSEGPVRSRAGPSANATGTSNLIHHERRSTSASSLNRRRALIQEEADKLMKKAPPGKEKPRPQRETTRKSVRKHQERASSSHPQTETQQQDILPPAPTSPDRRDSCSSTDSSQPASQSLHQDKPGQQDKLAQAPPMMPQAVVCLHRLSTSTRRTLQGLDQPDSPQAAEGSQPAYQTATEAESSCPSTDSEPELAQYQPHQDAKTPEAPVNKRPAELQPHTRRSTKGKKKKRGHGWAATAQPRAPNQPDDLPSDYQISSSSEEEGARTPPPQNHIDHKRTHHLDRSAGAASLPWRERRHQQPLPQCGRIHHPMDAQGAEQRSQSEPAARGNPPDSRRLWPAGSAPKNAETVDFESPLRRPRRVSSQLASGWDSSLTTVEPGSHATRRTI